MNLAKMISLLFSAVIWRLTGLRPAGRMLVRALGTGDEDLRTVAGMMLVKGGKKAEPLLQEALEKRENIPIVLTVLGSLGDPDLEPYLSRFVHDTDPEISKSARDALDIIHYKGSY